MRYLSNYCLIAIAAICVGCGERTDVASKDKPASTTPASTNASAAPASLADGIAFAQPAYPSFVAKAEGLGQPEAFGRWTDGPRVAIEFKESLPKSFDLVVQGAAFGPNIGQPVKVTIGKATQEFSFASELAQATETRRMAFTLDEPANRIELA